MTEETDSPKTESIRGRGIVAARELLWLVVYALLSMAMTWPLARHLSRAVSDPGDPYLNAWILHWDWFATFTQASLYHANIFFPAQWTLAFSETLYGIAILSFPLRFAGVDPLTTYNIALIAGFALSGYGMHGLARVMLGRIVTEAATRESCALLAGIFFAFVPFRFGHLSHLQHIWSGWIPLSFAALVLLLRHPRVSISVAFIVAYVMNGLSNVHWLLFTAVATPVVALLILSLENRWRDRRVWLWFIAAFGIANLLLVPFLLPYSIVSDLYGFERGAVETAGYSARIYDWAVSAEQNRLWSHLNEELGAPERFLFPGMLVVLLSVVPLLMRRPGSMPEQPVDGARRTSKRFLRALDVVVVLSFLVGLDALGDRPLLTIDSLQWRSLPWLVFWFTLLIRLWSAYPSWMNVRSRSLRETLERLPAPAEYVVALSLILLGFLGSLGLNGFLHSFLYATLEPFRSLRVPARWAMISYCGLGIAAAFGMAFVTEHLEGRRRRLLIIVLPVLMLAELRAAPLLWHLGEGRTPVVYEWLARAPVSGGVLELPIGGVNEYDYVYRSTVHNRPIVNGISGFTTEFHTQLKQSFDELQIPHSVIDLLEQAGVSTIIVHGERTGDPRLKEWLGRMIAQDRLTFLGHFDHQLIGDFVFAVDANEPAIDELQDRSGPDPSGRTPHDNLMVFLQSTNPLWVGETFGYLDRPNSGQEIRGGLKVEGWALSPHGVREVNLLFQNESVRVTAQRSPDDRLLENHYPWYDEETPRFGHTFENRPNGVSRDTDLVVEIIDDRGQVTRLPQRMFRWVRESPRVANRIEHWNRDELLGLVERLGYSSDVASGVQDGSRRVEAIIEDRLDQTAHLSNREFIVALYRVVFERTPDQDGLALHVARLDSGTRRERIIEMFVDSEEFQRKYGQ